MSAVIGHASIDENRKIKGGIAGDQTGKEVCLRTWYNHSWDYVLRPTDPVKAELIAQACEKGCMNNHIGYDQNQRNTLRTQAQLCGYDLSRITRDCECDCSSFVAVCCECAGIRVPYSGTNAPTTLTLKTALLSTALFVQLVDPKYRNTDVNLKRGDIIIKEGSHVAIVVENKTAVKSDDPFLTIGSKGDYVKAVQTYLSILKYPVGKIDADYGPQTAKAVLMYQKDRHLTQDSIWGPECWNSVK